MRNAVRFFVLAPLLAAVLTAPGCAGWNWSRMRGEGFQDEMATWSGKLRADEREGSPLGWSQKALEVERNLGYH